MVPVWRFLIRVHMSHNTEEHIKHEILWSGVMLKLDNARFHLDSMQRAIEPPPRTQTQVAHLAAGAVLGKDRHRPFMAHLDAFLASTRSVPEVINCCFGHDSSKAMKEWFNRLSSEEKTRRKRFFQRLKPDLSRFKDLPLTGARNVSFHRQGYPDVVITAYSLFQRRDGQPKYTGNPVQPLPSLEISPVQDQAKLPSVTFHAVYPDAIIIEQGTAMPDPFPDPFERYLKEACFIQLRARANADEVHNGHPVTLPGISRGNSS